MSTREILDEMYKLMNTDLTEEELALLEKMLNSIKFYKSLIPKDLKQDIVSLLIMANKYKSEYDIIKN